MDPQCQPPSSRRISAAGLGSGELGSGHATAPPVQRRQDPQQAVVGDDIRVGGIHLSFTASVVTLPLGVLQRVNRDGGMRFEPEPAAIARARRLAMGSAERHSPR